MTFSDVVVQVGCLMAATAGILAAWVVHAGLLRRPRLDEPEPDDS